jgi:hypothetical protein
MDSAVSELYVAAFTALMRQSSTSDIALFAGVENPDVCAEVTIELWLGE